MNIAKTWTIGAALVAAFFILCDATAPSDMEAQEADAQSLRDAVHQAQLERPEL